MYCWDPSSSTLRQIVDVNAITPRLNGEPAWSKVHARTDEGADGRIYFSGTLNAAGRAGQPQYKWSEAIPGGQLYAYDPATGKTTVVANLPPRRATATSLMDRRHSTWWCMLEAGDGDALWGFDLAAGKPIVQTPDGTVKFNRNFAVGNDGSVYFNGDGGIWRCDPRTGQVAATGADLGEKGWMRSSTRAASSGGIYGVTMRPGRIFHFNPASNQVTWLGPDFLDGNYTTVCVLSPDERFLYYLPGAHGQAFKIGTPVVQYDIAKDQRKVIAFLRDPIEQQCQYVPAGTYGVKINADGSTLYANLNGHAADAIRPAKMKANGFGLTAFVAIHIPASER
jgi:sugar lactone lactonase YvrE